MDARQLKSTLFLALSVAVFSVTFLGQTQVAQAQTALSLNTPVTGSVTPNGTNLWTFSAQNGAVLSFFLQAQSSSFDPAMTITDSSGHVVISSDDYNYPVSLDPLLEAITLPRTDTYTLTIRGVNNTSGGYVLTMLPGYSVVSYTDDFSSSQWKAFDSTITVQQSDGQLQITSQGTMRPTSAAFETGSAHTVADFYAQAQVVNVTDPSGWAVGMALRRQGGNYYLLTINSLGSWRFSLIQNGAERVIRDWTQHPNIIPGANSFTIGALAKGAGFDFFYNGGYIGSASDNTLTGAGQIGLTAGAFSSVPSQSSATFDVLLVTVPMQVDGANVIPQEVTLSDASHMVLSLKRNHVVSADGELSFTLPDSSVQYARPGINQIMLGRGARYTDFAIGTVVDLSAAASGPAGCGVSFRFNSDTDYTLAYLDQNGEYGISKRTGNTFAPGFSGVNSNLHAGQHHLLIIANQNIIYYYIDGQLVGTLENSPQEGQIGIAVVNFEPNTTSCQYSNFWLWKWN